MIRPAQWRTIATDALLASVLAVVLTAPSLILAAHSSASEALFVAGVGVVMFALVTLRRVAPALTLVVVLAMGIVDVLIGIEAVHGVWFQVLVLLYTAGRHERTAGRLVAAGVMLLASVVVGYFSMTWLLIGAQPDQTAMLFVAGSIPALLLFGSAFGIGVLVAAVADSSRARAERQRAEEVATIASERAAIEGERTAIARDMHDVVAHSLAVVIAQANGARYAKDPMKKDAALQQISSVSSQALGDVRLLLAQLRHSQAADPTASIDDVPALVERLRDAGLDARLVITGMSEQLPRTASIAAYRIVQESLTNALRHGDRSEPVLVRLAWGGAAGGGLSIDVHNRMRGAPGPAGHGITGMRERAALAGLGYFAGPDAGWFRVHASWHAAQGAPGAATRREMLEA